MSLLSWSDRPLARIGMIHAATQTRRFRRAVHRANLTQARLLQGLLTRAAGSEFGREHGLERVSSYEQFRSRVPIRDYGGFAPYLDRCLGGDTAALFRPGERILMFALTSGTTAEPKYIPITARSLADIRRGWNTWGLAALNDHPRAILRHIVQVTSPMDDHLAPSGAPCGAITGLLAARQKRLVRKYYTSPLAIAGIKDSASKYYAIMRLALPKDVAWLVTANPSTLLLLARSADEHRETIVRDIHDGTLSANFEIESPIRRALAPHISADPPRASRLSALVEQHGALLPRHYWNLDFLAHWTGGTMGLYAARLADSYGDVPSRDIGLIASEGRVSIPLEDGTPTGVLAVTSQFFEFIPAEAYGRDGPPVLRSHEVRAGEDYFLLLTNSSGLFRYDLGDRVRVNGFLGQAPLIEFLSRDAHTASMAGEKLTENQIILGMKGALTDAVSIERFVVAARWADPPYYRLYLEDGAPLPPGTAADRLDQELRHINVEYDGKRSSLRLGPIETALLPRGFLRERERQQRQAKARVSEQFKQQYLLPLPGADAELERAAVRPS